MATEEVGGMNHSSSNGKLASPALPCPRPAKPPIAGKNPLMAAILAKSRRDKEMGNANASGNSLLPPPPSVVVSNAEDPLSDASSNDASSSDGPSAMMWTRTMMGQESCDVGRPGGGVRATFPLRKTGISEMSNNLLKPVPPGEPSDHVTVRNHMGKTDSGGAGPPPPGGGGGGDHGGGGGGPGSPGNNNNNNKDVGILTSADSVDAKSAAGSQDGGNMSTGGTEHNRRKIAMKVVRRMTVGLTVTSLVALAWVGATHAIKYAYMRHRWPEGSWPFHIQEMPIPASMTSHQSPSTAHHSHHRKTGHHFGGNSSQTYASSTSSRHHLLDEDVVDTRGRYDAPFLTTWWCTMWTILFMPFFLLLQIILIRDIGTVRGLFIEAAQQFQMRGLSPMKFCGRIIFFSVLWVGTNYMYMLSLRILDSTTVMSLYASSVGFVYLLSWVILHDQFVGVRIVAVICCNTGIALLAYMDGIAKTSTLGGVVLGSAAAAGSAVYKVLFKKLIGEASFTQVALFFSLISLVNALLFWPLPFALYMTELETFSIRDLPWIPLTMAGALSLVANLLGNLGILLTYDVFITLGLLIAIPISGVCDTLWYGLAFKGMKLGGLILIGLGFLLVLLPDDWPDYVTLLIRNRSNSALVKLQELLRGPDDAHNNGHNDDRSNLNEQSKTDQAADMDGGPS